MTQTLEAIQAQLAALQAKNNQMLATPLPTTLAPQQIQVQPVPQPPVNQNEVLLALIDERIASKLASISPQKPASNDLSLLVEGHLEKDEIAWLMKPEVSSQLGAFLSSTSGHEYVRLFFTEFKAYHENRT